ncbi:hypothetical protein JTB14_033898 [Gonioctena quinquepunctata]|nr:hypothetical protein JTB14_033898 [Gonioctena quinquepunctata]
MSAEPSFHNQSKYQGNIREAPDFRVTPYNIRTVIIENEITECNEYCRVSEVVETPITHYTKDPSHFPSQFVSSVNLSSLPTHTPKLKRGVVAKLLKYLNISFPYLSHIVGELCYIDGIHVIITKTKMLFF